MRHWNGCLINVSMDRNGIREPATSKPKKMTLTLSR